MQEEGFSLDDTTSNKIVTVTDKIKAQLAKAGVDISAFGDDLDFEQLAQITEARNLQRRLQTVCGRQICRLQMIILNRSQRQ